MIRALFLDRDGVINVNHGYVHRVEQFEFLPQIFDVCKTAQNLGYEIFVITNQAGIARGYYSEQDFLTLNEWMLAQFKHQGIEIKKTYFCPHHPEFTGDCLCRKPKPGLILQASQEFNIDLNKSIMLGDKESDIQAAQNAKIGLSILVENSEEVEGKIISYHTKQGL